ncbi:MAG: hypothetical protein KC983_09970 [Phycisphaerales bacterium]|nr:hypothetical protein [Phycisphaerales bacterium]
MCGLSVSPTVADGHGIHFWLGFTTPELSHPHTRLLQYPPMTSHRPPCRRLVACLAAGCAFAAALATPAAPDVAPTDHPATPTTQTQPALRTILPGVRCDVAGRIVEFDARIVVDQHAAPAPLECIICTPNTKEHESLLVADILPSHLHAALLMIGLEPGRPGGYLWQNEALVPRHPEGPALRIELVRTVDGITTTVDPRTWIIAQNETTSLDDASPRDGWIFAGSLITAPAHNAAPRYAADLDGTLIGLAAFGSETIAWASTISTEAMLTVHTWIADPRALPPTGTDIIVRITPIAAPPEEHASP